MTSSTPDSTPPTYDRPAVLRWHRQMAVAVTPWLYEEAARRMLERLQWFRSKPKDWTHFCPALSGAEVHARLVEHCGSRVVLVESELARRARVDRQWVPPWWHWRRWLGPAHSWQEPGPHSQDMVWANLSVHAHVDPAELLRRWYGWLRVDGFVMFSCLGPDTALELRHLYQARGWPPPAADLTDMHDWGDMLVRSGFAEPVMDMERLTLTFTSAQALLAELGQWGRNVHRQRFAQCRGRAWRQGLLAAIEQDWPRQPDGRLGLTVELVYGHALKPAARWKADTVSTVAVDDLRRSLRASKTR